jgi:hypothetical protein
LDALYKSVLLLFRVRAVGFLTVAPVFRRLGIGGEADVATAAVGTLVGVP